jgi:sulfhydrogenase subunit beta (sulfur reductase)
VQAVTENHKHQAKQQLQQAAATQQRQLPDNIARVLRDNPEANHWNDVAGRCLSCGNCTMVCPSCFCHAQLDEPELDGQSSLHFRQWDSCFTQGHSYIHGITIRTTTRERYRQWLTHKFSAWHDQYGRSGCVGCGRCITWCPVEIDVTKECQAMAQEAGGQGESV